MNIQESGKKLIILKQISIFNKIDACKWEPRLKKVFSRARVCEYDSEFIEEWQQPSISFIERFIADFKLESFEPSPFFAVPVQRGVNLYSDKDHLNSYGFHYLGGYFQKYLDGLVSASNTGVESRQ